MNTFRVALSCFVTAAAAVTLYHLWPRMQEIADAVGIELLGAQAASFILLGAVFIFCVWVGKATKREQYSEVTSEGLILSAPIIEPVDGKVILRPGQVLKIVADMPRGAKGRYIGLEKAL